MSRHRVALKLAVPWCGVLEATDTLETRDPTLNHHYTSLNNYPSMLQLPKSLPAFEHDFISILQRACRGAITAVMVISICGSDASGMSVLGQGTAPWVRGQSHSLSE